MRMKTIYDYSDERVHFRDICSLFRIKLESLS